MTRGLEPFRVHVAGVPGKTEHTERFHHAGARFAGAGLHAGIAAGRPWIAVTINAASPVDAALAAGRYMEDAAGPLTELFAWPMADDVPAAEASLPQLPDLTESGQGETTPVDARAGIAATPELASGAGNAQ